MTAVPGGKAVDWSGILLRRDAGRDSTLVDVYQGSAGLVSTGPLVRGAAQRLARRGAYSLDCRYAGSEALAGADSAWRRRRSVRGSTRRCPRSRARTRSAGLGPEVTCSHVAGSSSARAVLCVSPHDGE